MRFAVVPTFVLLASCGSSPEVADVSSGTPSAGSAVGPVTLVYTGRGEGEIEPCG